MRLLIVRALAIGVLSTTATACSRPSTVPSDPVVSHVGTVDQLVGSLRAQGRNVSVGGETSPQRNGYFSVSSRDVMIGEARLKAFEYETASKADADAALVTSEGQPNPHAILDWIAAPHFYKQGRLIVNYIGCAEDIVRTLDELLGPAIATGPGCSR